MYLQFLFHCQCGYIYLLLCVVPSLPFICFFLLSFVVVFVCLATHGGSPNKGLDRPIEVQKQNEKFLKENSA